MSGMEARKQILKVEIEYFELSEARELLRMIRVNGFNVMQSLSLGNAKAIVTGHSLDFEKSLTDFELFPKEPDRIEVIDGKTHYFYKSKM